MTVSPTLEFEHKLRAYVGEVRQKMIRDVNTCPDLYSVSSYSVERATIQYNGPYNVAGCWAIIIGSECVTGAQLHEVADEMLRRFLVKKHLDTLPALLSPPTVTQEPEPFNEDEAVQAAADDGQEF